MKTITTKEGIQIAYKDLGKGQTVLFSHGWPLSADAWEGQMLFLLNQGGYRVIAHDRRGHGRSTDTFENNTMDQYADDLAQLIEQLDLRRPIYKKTAAYGHFGREEDTFSWEKTDKVIDLKQNL